MANNETKKEFTMKPVFTMWIYQNEGKNKYLSGKTEDGTKLVGFFNGKKKNPKEPDIRVYVKGEEKEEYCSLWCNVSKNEKKYLSGKVGDTKVIGFLNKNAKLNGNHPYFSVYESDATPKAKDEMLPVSDESLPFS